MTIYKLPDIFLRGNIYLGLIFHKSWTMWNDLREFSLPICAHKVTGNIILNMSGKINAKREINAALILDNFIAYKAGPGYLSRMHKPWLHNVAWYSGHLETLFLRRTEVPWPLEEKRPTESRPQRSSYSQYVSSHFAFLPCYAIKGHLQTYYKCRPP